jgi:oligopeptide transport system substrate-binding protein
MNVMPKIRMVSTVALFVAATLATVTACSSSDGGDQTSASGGSISIAQFEPDHLTPGWGNSNQADIARALFAPLAALDADNNYQLVMAESITTSDNKIWTIKIKPGWTFHNGEEVVAQSYVDGLNTTAYGPNAWAENYSLTNIEGYDALNPAEGEPTSKTMSGLKVIDDHTFEVTLKTPNNQLKYELMGTWAWAPLPKAALADLAAYDKAPIGNGPFQMDGTWDNPTSSVKVKAYEAYKGPKPKVSNIEFKIYSSADAAYTDLLAGNVDLNGRYTAVPGSKLAQVKSDFSDRVVTADQVNTRWLGFPSADSRFTDIRIRHAISMGIDRDTITSKIFGGVYTPARGLFAPGSIGGSPDGCGEFCEYDPAKAKALLAAAGGWSGPLELQYIAGKGFEPYVQAIANGLRQNLGIDVVLVASPTTSEFNSAVKSGTKGMFTGGWAGGAWPSDILTGAFQKASSYNFASGSYSSEVVDSLILQAKSATTSEEATKLFHEANAEIMKDFPVAPMFNYTSVTIYSDRIEKPVVTSSGAMLDQITLK